MSIAVPLCVIYVTRNLFRYELPPKESSCHRTQGVPASAPVWARSRPFSAYVTWCHFPRDTSFFHHEGHEEHLGGVVAGSVYYTPRGANRRNASTHTELAGIAQPITRFDGSSNSILRVLRALRGEFFCFPLQTESETTSYYKLHNVISQSSPTLVHR